MDLDPSGVIAARPVPPESDIDTCCRRFDRFASGASLPLIDVPAYTLFAITGFAVGFAAALGLTLYTAAPLATLVLATAAAAQSFALVTAARAWRADRGHVFLENLLVALAAAAAVPWLLDEPIGPLLDVVMIGLGALSAFGRLGCLATGCCHGRPAAWGVRYGPASVVPPSLVGVRLFPIQLVDAGWCAAITAVAIALVVAGAPPLTATWWWLLAYGTLRFVLELARGDESRRRLGPLSESQWIAIALLVACILHREPDWRAPRVIALAALPIVVLVTALLARGWLPAPALARREAAAWRALLERLDSDAAAGRGVIAADAPWSGVTVTAQWLPVADGTLRCLALAGPELDDDRATAFAGWVLGAAPAHVVIRAAWPADDRFELWLLVADDGVPGIESTDTDWEAWIRAHAFARAARRLALPWASRTLGA